MFVRVKTVGSRRYAYLVDGVRKGKRVRQRTLCYLGPISKISSGVPENIRKKIDVRYHPNWDKINDEIRRIPLTFEEVSKARLAQYAVSIMARKMGRRSQGDLPRTKGELSALSKLAAMKFGKMFEEIGEREYRMR
jgi:hypothetical protein